VLVVFSMIAVAIAFLSAYTDRLGFWTLEGNAIRWTGVVGWSSRKPSTSAFGHRYCGTFRRSLSSLNRVRIERIPELHCPVNFAIPIGIIRHASQCESMSASPRNHPAEGRPLLPYFTVRLLVTGSIAKYWSEFMLTSFENRDAGTQMVIMYRVADVELIRLLPCS
jgi:hypothetical protein